MMLGSAAVSVVAGLFGAAVAGTSVFGVMTLASFGVGLAGFVKRSRAKRYRQYVQKLTGKDYCAIDDLAAAVGRKRKYVLKDLQDILSQDGSQDARERELRLQRLEQELNGQPEAEGITVILEGEADGYAG